jgi:hypothetical protein
MCSQRDSDARRRLGAVRLCAAGPLSAVKFAFINGGRCDFIEVLKNGKSTAMGFIAHCQLRIAN